MSSDLVRRQPRRYCRETAQRFTPTGNYGDVLAGVFDYVHRPVCRGKRLLARRAGPVEFHVASFSLFPYAMGKRSR